MKKILTLSTLPVLALLGACGPANDIIVTNDSNVVLNDHLANYASVNDGEVPTVNGTTGAPVSDMAPGNGSMSNGTMPSGDGTAMNDTSPGAM